jgi:hypothetical protein
MADIKIGDRVRVVRELVAGTGVYDGYTGSVTKVDVGDIYPYLVALDDEKREVWMHDVERVGSPSDRDALVARAKEHLAGTTHTADDIIRLAEFLAG